MSQQQQSLIGQRYQIQSELGAGGMGIVYQALDTQTGQTVAVKHLKSRLTDHDQIERFKREGEALRDLNHPNIVKMLDTIAEDDNHYLIIEYLSGGDLRQLLAQGQLPTEKILRLAIDIGDALTRAHRLNIIHRDLKPANVLLAADGTPRLTDFGIALITEKERLTSQNAFFGTIDYLPPEAFEGQPLDRRADIWAFGVMLYEMLAGERPFNADSITTLMRAILVQPIPDLEQLRPDAPIALIDLVYRMLEKDRQARISSVRHVGAYLEDILHGRSTKTPPATRFDTPTLLETEILHRPKHNLPSQTTPFVGREPELTELSRFLDDPNIRLITVVAPGGMGKSRLALQIAENHWQAFKHAACFVELAPLTEAANIPSAIAEATDYQFQTDGRDQKQQILNFLSNKHMLLILDNFEHVLAGAPLVTAMLKAAPDVKIIATSRQRLNQVGETVMMLSGMGFPDWETPDDALEYAAVKLFLQSAKRARPQFELSADNLDSVARICRLVQGMPLGILLAASWLAMLQPDEIAAEIQRNIDFLQSDMTDLPERQRSLRAVFDYSWALMSETEQEVFMKLSVFQGGFTREAAETVTNANLRTLMSLTNKSLIRRDVDSGRYNIHELLRQHTRERLIAFPPLLEACQRQHSQFYAEFLHQRWRPLRSPKLRETVREIEVEFDNIRIAWKYMVNSGALSEIRKSLYGLWWFLWLTNRGEDGVELFGIDLNLADDKRSEEEIQGVICNLRSAQGWFYVLMGQHATGKAIAAECIDTLRGTSRLHDLILPLTTLAQATTGMGQQEESQQVAYEYLRVAKEIEDDWFVAGSMIYLGGIPDQIQAKRYLEECLEIAEQYGDPFALGAANWALGSLASNQGHYEEGRQLFHKAIPFLEQSGQIFMMAFTRRSLTWAALTFNNYAEAKAQFRECLLLYERNGQRWETLNVLKDVADLFHAQDLKPRAVELTILVRDHPATVDQTRETAAELLSKLKSELSEAVFSAAYERGQSLDLETEVEKLLDEFAPA